MRIRIFPYKMSSHSGKALANGLGVLRLRKTGSFQPHHGDIIINWGNSVSPSWENGRGIIINSFDRVAFACNKWNTFKELARNNVPIPDFTQLPAVAQQWVDEEHRVYGRQILTGHSGAGIVIFNKGDTISSCPLYTKNTKAKYEYRVHVMNGQVLDVQQKKKREGFEGGAVGIRNHVNGWVFCRENIVVPECVTEVSLKAVQALGLHFGAVDVGWNERENRAYVYEVNTAPGITNTTLAVYIAGFKREYLGG